MWTNLRLAQLGPSVRRAEQALIAAGVRVADGVDGVFKIGDYYAVRTFQRMRGLTVTGEVDVPTASRLGLFAAPPTSAVAMSVLAAPAAPTSTTTTSTTIAPATTTSTSTSTTSSTAAPTTDHDHLDHHSTPPAGGAGARRDGLDRSRRRRHPRQSTSRPVAGLTVTLRDDRGDPVRTAVTGNTASTASPACPTAAIASRWRAGRVTPSPVVDREVGVPVGVDPDDVDSDVVLDDTGTLADHGARRPRRRRPRCRHRPGRRAPAAEPPTSTTGPAPTSVEPVDTTTAEDTAPTSSATHHDGRHHATVGSVRPRPSPPSRAPRRHRPRPPRRRPRRSRPRAPFLLFPPPHDRGAAGAGDDRAVPAAIVGGRRAGATGRRSTGCAPSPSTSWSPTTPASWRSPAGTSASTCSSCSPASS